MRHRHHKPQKRFLSELLNRHCAKLTDDPPPKTQAARLERLKDLESEALRR